MSIHLTQKIRAAIHNPHNNSKNLFGIGAISIKQSALLCLRMCIYRAPGRLQISSSTLLPLSPSASHRITHLPTLAQLLHPLSPHRNFPKIAEHHVYHWPKRDQDSVDQHFPICNGGTSFGTSRGCPRRYRPRYSSLTVINPYNPR